MKVADIRSNLGFHNCRVFLRAQLRERHKPVLYMEITKIRIILQLCCYEQFWCADCYEEGKAVVKLGCSFNCVSGFLRQTYIDRIKTEAVGIFKMLSCYDLLVWWTVTCFWIRAETKAS